MLHHSVPRQAKRSLGVLQFNDAKTVNCCVCVCVCPHWAVCAFGLEVELGGFCASVFIISSTLLWRALPVKLITRVIALVWAEIHVCEFCLFFYLLLFKDYKGVGGGGGAVGGWKIGFTLPSLNWWSEKGWMVQGSLCASASEVLACTCVSPVSSPTPSRFTAVTLDQRCHTGAYIALLHCQLSPLCPAEMSGFMSVWFYAPTCLYFSLFHIPYRTWICIYMRTTMVVTLWFWRKKLYCI